MTARRGNGGRCPHPRPLALARERGEPATAWAVACAAVPLLLWLLFGASAAAQQEGGGLHHAGLVVRHGDGRVTYAYVPFAEEEIDGVELLRRSGLPLVTVPFGGLGEGVCSLEGEGCGVEECRRRVCQGSRPDDPYWQYFRQESPGAWRPLALGASGTKVRDGDIDGWSWTGGEAGLPALSLVAVAAAAGATEAGTPVTAAEPFVRTVLPPGTDSPRPETGQDWPAYAAAAGILAAIGAGALLATRRPRPEST